jgi:tetratricopeptide (TPR) repeat protein
MTRQKFSAPAAHAMDEERNGALFFANKARRGDSGYSREVVLLICLSLLVAMFIVTGVVTRAYHKRIHTLADHWFAEGEQSYQAGDTAAAVASFRNALVYSPDKPEFQFHLAQALDALGNYGEAQSYLLNLLAESPGSGDINLALARIAAHNGSITDAMRYYSSAIYGVWDKDPLATRWDVRFELCKYLLDQNATTEAQPELIALAQETPSGDREREKKAGALLLRANLWDRALAEFRLASASDRHDAEALAGAGRAAFGLGKYTEAIDYFERLPSKERENPDVAALVEDARAIQSADPFLAGLSNREKAKRTASALVQANSRALQCAQQRGQSLSSTTQATSLQRLYATNQKMKADWSAPNLESHPDRVDAAMSLVFQMEDAASQECGAPPPGSDNVLLLIGRSHGGGGQ